MKTIYDRQYDNVLLSQTSSSLKC